MPITFIKNDDLLTTSGLMKCYQSCDGDKMKKNKTDNEKNKNKPKFKEKMDEKILSMSFLILFSSKIT